jgi:leucine dehydrogenase
VTPPGRPAHRARGPAVLDAVVVAWHGAPGQLSRRRRGRSSLAAIDRYLETLDHEELLVRRGRRSSLYTVIAVHSTARGPSLGGCRMWSYEDSRAAVRDALRLSRAMTSKSAVAGLPLGGGKGVIMLPPGARALDPGTRRDALLDFGDSVAQLDGRYVTAEDVGTSDADMTVIAEQTDHVAGLALERGGSGDPSPWTALGVETAIRVTCERLWGTDDLSGRRIAVIGLGSVGGALARELAAAGASLVVADVAPGKRALADELRATWAEPDEALRAEVDLVAPCALGGLLDHASVPQLRCRAVAGAANNQLASDDIAGVLHARGILWTPDFVANAGGIINIAVELEPEGYSADRARSRVLAIGNTVRTVLDMAESAGVSPLAAAQELARRRLAEVGAPAGDTAGAVDGGL